MKAPKHWDKLLQRAAKYVNLEDALRLKKVDTPSRVDKMGSIHKDVRVERREPNREVKGLRYAVEKRGGPRYTNCTPLVSSMSQVLMAIRNTPMLKWPTTWSE